MIKIIFCLRRLSHLTLAQFHRYWLETHAPLVRDVAPLLRIRSYTQCHSLEDPRILPAVQARGCGIPPYDGVAELCWTSVADIIAAGETKESRAAGRRLLEDEKNFIDLANSTLFFTQEHEIIATA